MRTPRVEFISMIVLAVAVAACSERSGVAADNAGPQTSGDSVPGRAAACMPLETREPNAPDQRPAFPRQTRACAIQSNVAFDVGVLAKGLENPWAVEPLPGGGLLVTEKPGRLALYVVTGGANGELWKITASLKTIGRLRPHHRRHRTILSGS